MDARTTTESHGGRARTGRRCEHDPLTWWRTRDPSTITPKQSLTLWSRVQNVCLEAGLDAHRLETSRLVCLAIEGSPDRDLVMAHLLLKAIDGNAGAMTVIANELRREGAVCAKLSGAWAGRLLTVGRRRLPAARASGPEA